MTATLSKKSGKGLSQGVLSEMSTFFSIRPGHVEELYAAIQRFGAATREAAKKAGKSGGAHDVRFVIFDNGSGCCGPHPSRPTGIPISMTRIAVQGQDMFVDWMQHTVEAITQYPDGIDRLSSAEIKQFLQSAQVSGSLLRRCVLELHDLGAQESGASCADVPAGARQPRGRRGAPAPGPAPAARAGGGLIRTRISFSVGSCFTVGPKE